MCCDGDGQYDPDDLPRLLGALSPGTVVAGARSPRRDSRSRMLASWAFGRVYRLLTGVRMKDPSSPFVAAFRRDVLSVLPATPRSPSGVLVGVLRAADAAGLRIVEVPVAHRRREGATRIYTARAAAADRPRPSRRAGQAPGRAETASAGDARSAPPAVVTKSRELGAGRQRGRHARPSATGSCVGRGRRDTHDRGRLRLHGRGGYQQIDRLIWRLAEIPRMVSAGASLATTFPLRFVFLVLGSVALMLAAEYRPRALLGVSTAVWVSLGSRGYRRLSPQRARRRHPLGVRRAPRRKRRRRRAGAARQLPPRTRGHRRSLGRKDRPGGVLSFPSRSAWWEACSRCGLRSSRSRSGTPSSTTSASRATGSPPFLGFHTPPGRRWVRSSRTTTPRSSRRSASRSRARCTSASARSRGSSHRLRRSRSWLSFAPWAPSALFAGLGGADVPPRQHVLRRVRRVADRLHADDRADRSRGRAARGREAVDAGDGPVHRSGRRDRADRRRLRAGRPRRLSSESGSEAHARP